MLQPKSAAPAVEIGAGAEGLAAAEEAGVGAAVVTARVELLGMTTGVEVGASGWPSEDSETTGMMVVAGADGTGAALETGGMTTGVEVGASGWPSEDSETTGMTVEGTGAAEVTTTGAEVGASG